MSLATPNLPETSIAAPPPPRPATAVGRPLSRAMRARKDRLFVTVCVIAASLSVLVLIVLLGSVGFAGAGRLTRQFLTGSPSRFVDQAGILPAMAGTLAICLVCFVTAVPVGVATAVLLEEFKPKSWLLRKAHLLVQLNITNLAGVPSIVYGILGLTVFVQFFNLVGNGNAPALEVGTRYYDRFVTLDGQSALVPVGTADAPPTRAGEATPFVASDGKPTAVRVVDAATIGEASRTLEARLDALQYELEDRFDALKPLDAPALAAAVAQGWTKVGLPDAPPAALAPAVHEALAKSGREAKKALRSAVKSTGAAVTAAQFPRTLLSDAAPSRVSEPQPWYVRFPFGRSVLAGGLTLMLVVLPIVIISTQEALRAVSDSLRRASLALGATRWQTIWNVTLPSALPGVMTGVILAMSRAIGEAAPVLIIAGIVYITFTPRHLMDDFTAMPLQIYQWASLPQQSFHEVAAAGIIVLLGILLCFNLLAIVIRQRAQKHV